MFIPVDNMEVIGVCGNKRLADMVLLITVCFVEEVNKWIC